MRIRTIKPEFWRSDDVAKLPRELRLLFVGLWSYVDDNGVGIDDHRQVTADLFPLDDDIAETREFVREGLATLSRESLIVRYSIDAKAYLSIPTWEKHQKIDKPGKPRYPRPEALTSGYGASRDESRDAREDLAPVVSSKEQGSRSLSSVAVATADVDPPVFDEFWAVWPRKIAKDAARKKFAAAVRKGVDPALIVATAKAQTERWKVEHKESQYIPHAATWLNQGRFEDEPEKPSRRLGVGGYDSQTGRRTELG